MDRCQLWVGANNWDPAVHPNNVYLASDMSLALPPLTIMDVISDGNTENCVVANGAAHAQPFDDFNCQCWKFDFLCENIVEPPPCDDLTQDEVDLEVVGHLSRDAARLEGLEPRSAEQVVDREFRVCFRVRRRCDPASVLVSEGRFKELIF